MSVAVQRVAMIAMHTSPAAQPGTADAGGLNVAVLGVAAELAARGVQVDLVTRGDGGARDLLPGVTLHELSAGPAGILPKERLPEVADEFGEAIARLARTRHYDILHSHYWLSGIATLPVAIELDRPLVQSFHTLGAMKNALAGSGQPPEPVQRVRSEMFLAAQADAVIASSSAEATVLIDDVGAPPDRTWIIPPGVERAMAQRAGSTITEYKAGHLGLLTDPKTVTHGIERAARASVR